MAQVAHAPSIAAELAKTSDARTSEINLQWDEAVSQSVTPPATPITGSDLKKHIPKKYDVSQIGNRGIGKGFNLYSIEKEQALGREMAREMDSNARILKDPVIDEYINRLGQNLVRNSDARVPFTIKVVEDDEVNAFALPGGYFYVNTGLIMAADSESELAGVMAHEIAHVAARHATRNMTKGEIWNFASIPLIFVGGPVGFAVQEAAGLALPMSFLKFSRDAEREADLLGIEYEYKAGYDPTSFVSFFEKLKAQEKHKQNFIAKAFSTHPMTADRVERAQREIAEYLPPRPQYIVDTSEFDQVKARLASILNQRTLLEKKSNRPTLMRSQNGSDVPDNRKSGSNDNDRPTLKRPSQP
ncbi:MAG TPA: M48 family metallopeptidase [Terriglobales bacterium]|nr:M48 family metallopeptidase [Terriglobales bacterium]